MIKIEPDEDRLNRNIKKWDQGIHTFPVVGDEIINTKPGDNFDRTTIEILKGCTVCPVGNATCTSVFEIVFYGFHPKKAGQKKSVLICPHGCNIETCLLNK